MVTNAEIHKELKELARKVATQDSIDELKKIINEQSKEIKQNLKIRFSLWRSKWIT